jgi:multidrug resistance efflux pump
MALQRSNGKIVDRAGSRRGFALRGLLIALALVAGVVVIAWVALPRLSLSSQENGPMMASVERGLFVHDITERGSIESANNVEIKCKVKSRSGGITILEVVPEGTVIKPEDCIPETAVVSLDAVLKLDKWREEQKKAGLLTEDGLPVSKAKSANVTDGGNGHVDPEPDQSTSDVSETKGTEGDNGEAGATPSQSNGDGPGEALSESEDRTSDDQQLESDGPEENELTFEDIKDKMVLVRFNSKEYEDSLLQQQIVCENSLAVVKGAEASYNTAVISKKEYIEGTYQKLLKTQEAAITRAQEALARAQEYYTYSEELYGKGFIPENELKANKFAVTDKQLAQDIAELEMVVLEKYTYEKELEQLEANIGTAQAKLVAAEKSHELDKDQLDEIEEQIINCTVFATQPGQVVYANETNRWGSSETVIEAGATIRERQTILRLPDPSNMQVNAKINEAKVSLVNPGMRATVRLEASPNEALRGEVIEVGEYPAATSWMRGDVKEYEVIIKIEGLEENPREDLRAGFTAEVSIRVAEQPDALQLPIQSILEHGGKHYCVVHAGKDEVEAKEVKVGMSNDKFVVIEEGLEEGEQVIHNAVKFRDDLDLPEIKEEPTQTTATGVPGSPGASPATPGAPSGQGPPSGQGQRPSPGQQGRGSGQGAAGGFDPAAVVGAIFSRQDKDSNGKLEGDEIPAQMKSRVSDIDKNGDGAVDRAEMTAAMKQMAGQRGGGGRPGGAGPGGGVRAPAGGAPGGGMRAPGGRGGGGPGRGGQPGGSPRGGGPRGGSS